MRRNALAGWNKTQLRIVMVVFFIALSIPTAILIVQAYSQLKWEAFHRHRVLAEELVARIDQRYGEILAQESARAFTDYAFLNVAGDPAAKLLQRSPLSAYPVNSNIPGAIGYFQIDDQGHFSTPLLPDSLASASGYGISKVELQKRSELRDQLHKLLSVNKLLHQPEVTRRTQQKKDQQPPAPAAAAAAPAAPEPGYTSNYSASAEADNKLKQEVASQAMFDRLAEEAPPVAAKSIPKSLGRIEDLEIEDRYKQRSDKALEERKSKLAETKKSKAAPLRKEVNVLPEPVASPAEKTGIAKPAKEPRINMFESEIDAFEFSALDSGHFVIYRKVWRDGKRYIQGLLIDQTAFLSVIIDDAYFKTALSQSSNLAVAYQGNLLSLLQNKDTARYLSSAGELKGNLLYQSRLSMPLSRLELIFSVNNLPAGPGGTVITWLAVILLLVLSGGTYLMYRLGSRQITLARQQQDFVSAVSHELKTPLTSIRMYGEMLREGWAAEEKRKTYYDFIYEESERLTRLINNVLQLARMTRNDLRIELKPCRVSQLMDTLRSKISTQVERADFILNLDCPETCRDKILMVDSDYFTQIMINLVDNALKFSAKADKKQIDVHCELQRDGRMQFCVRDYGPGVPKNQMRKIFGLFYRMENELTRETVGTGIGLALVKQLISAMHGTVDVVNLEPGAEFRISLSTPK